MFHPSPNKNSRRRWLALFSAAICLGQWLVSRPALAHGELAIMPARVVLEGNKRNTAISLVNIGNTTATYRLSMIRQRMTELGTFQDAMIPVPGEQFADDMVRFSPKQVTLRPREAQTVRLQAHAPGALTVGEYRSHLLIRAIPVAPGATGSASDTMSVTLIPVYGFTIPVIVRLGQTAAQVALSALQLKPATANEPPQLKVRLERTGTRSAYADLVVTHRNGAGATTVVGRTNGVAVYVPNASRTVAVPLYGATPKHLQEGSLQVTYREKPEDGGAILAQAEFVAP